MRRCPITYQVIPLDQEYSWAGLKLLSPKLTRLKPLPFSAAQLRYEAAQRASKMSIQGIQPKLSCVLSLKSESFEIVDSKGRYILKPEHDGYPEVPQNEDLTMKLAALMGIETPLHGLVYGIDGAQTYFIKRFDRVGQVGKLAVEDFAQLSNSRRSTKYNASMEGVVKIIDQFATFPMIEKSRLFTRTLFNFLVGNEDMHLKNFSMIIREGKVELSPAYDLVNSTIIVRDKEELALPLDGKKTNIRRKTLVEYFGAERMKLPRQIIHANLEQIESKLPQLFDTIEISFLSDDMKGRYLEVLKNRIDRVF